VIDAATRWLATRELTGPTSAAVDVPSLLVAAQRHRLVALLARVVAGGAVDATAAERLEVFDVAARVARQCVAIEAHLASMVERLNSRGVRPVVLKGCAVAHLDYAEPADREFIDADILVRAEDLGAVLDDLEPLVYRRNLPERRRGFDARFGKVITLQHEWRPELDLHVRPAFGVFGQRVVPHDLFAHCEVFYLAGVEASALDAPGRLVHACYNAVLADATPRVVALRDVALMVRAGRVGLDELRDRSREWGGEVVVATAIALVWRTLGLDIDDDISRWAARYRPRWADRLLLRTYPSIGGAFSLCLLAGALGVDGPVDKARYLRAFLRPAREYRMARRSAGRVGEYREGVRQVMRMIRPQRG